jgi:hypothetical protein
MQPEIAVRQVFAVTVAIEKLLVSPEIHDTERVVVWVQTGTAVLPGHVEEEELDEILDDGSVSGSSARRVLIAARLFVKFSVTLMSGAST